jgi:hypothetical protein
LSNFAHTCALHTGSRLSSCSSAGRATRFARNGDLYRHFFLDTKHGLREFQINNAFLITPPRRTSASTPSASTAAAERISTTKKRTQNVAKVTETAEPGERIATAAAQPVDTVLVICASLIRILQDLVRNRNLFEPLFGRSVTGVGIWMQFTGASPICLFELVFGRCARHAEQRIKISFVSHEQSSRLAAMCRLSALPAKSYNETSLRWSLRPDETASTAAITCG